MQNLSLESANTEKTKNIKEKDWGWFFMYIFSESKHKPQIYFDDSRFFVSQK